jgi:hypothetical protein
MKYEHNAYVQVINLSKNNFDYYVRGKNGPHPFGLPLRDEEAIVDQGCQMASIFIPKSPNFCIFQKP